MKNTKNIEEYLYSLRGKGAKLGLERVLKLLGSLGNPQNRFKTIIIGGTSGKGSTAAMVSSILTEAGFKTGRFTSPHLSSLTERITINEMEINKKELEQTVQEIITCIEKMKETKERDFEHPTFFEVITATALLYFKKKKIDFAVLEVGLGGRLDATNVTTPEVCVITNVSLEHTKILGNTIEKITSEKAGIIKQGIPIITAVQGNALKIIEKICSEKHAKLMIVGKDIKAQRISADDNGQLVAITISNTNKTFFIPLRGRYQIENLACTIGIIEVLRNKGIKIEDHAMADGLKKTKWPGRMEIVQCNPLVVLDGAKDPEAMRRLSESIDDFKYNKMILVLGISSDKDIPNMVRWITPKADEIIITQHSIAERAADPAIIVKEIVKYNRNYEIREHTADAVKTAIKHAGKKDLVLVTGSLFTVGEAREIWHSRKKGFGREFNETPKK
ncbi:bifunctional folylpolyglutamate synthase/dihydrofolate synthase [Candidatus Micrarchaeota archaeon]|nr:bifunctional folylpolyglutamate synthase/dihydrofolate synthase [Candidatus Micrarchaeota archaeon]MBU1166156.1 bifunctional folylpolyglutamate synthase/dihydrofolate synthase [Candidatus Micrarchaeota archaeon]MBU1887300.1 bifunctional folylpolyglutamate synthase/dihydrofolate synthase [Candidatus Micrarchaeota archaeon]